MKQTDNLSLSRRALELLDKGAVRTLIICAGARNAPLVKSLDHFKNFEILYFFDERAAAFFALGRSKATGLPAAVVTTSGTAVAEMLPAIVEARYAQVPVVVITADRPKEFRGRGAPQSIEQVGIFSHYVETTHQADWDAQAQPEFAISKHSPSHLNICFSEPLFATEIADVNVQVGNFLSVKKPVVILGEIPAHRRHDVESFLTKLKAPIYAEGHSGLRSSKKLRPWLLRSGERFLATSYFQSQCDGVVRIGSVPTTRLWRDLEDKLSGWGVYSICDNPMSGLGRSSEAATSFADFFRDGQERLLMQFNKPENLELLEKDNKTARALDALLAKYSSSEPGFVRQLSDQLDDEARLFVGNSLPIREWDLAANTKAIEVAGNRGVNGIDGLVSTFLGWAKRGADNVILLGDLSALYDLSALWTDAQRVTPPVKIVVMNNSGGQIFNRMFRDDRFINRHELEFSKWAEMFGLDYLKIDAASSPADWSLLSGLREKSIVIELVPDLTATQNFWSDYDKLFQ